MSDKYINPFIIESRTQGVFVEWTWPPHTPNTKPKFSPTASRLNGQRYPDYQAALKDLQKLRTFPRGRKAYIHKLGSRQDVWQPSLARPSDDVVAKQDRQADVKLLQAIVKRLPKNVMLDAVSEVMSLDDLDGLKKRFP